MDRELHRQADKCIKIIFIFEHLQKRGRSKAVTITNNCATLLSQKNWSSDKQVQVNLHNATHKVRDLCVTQACFPFRVKHCLFYRSKAADGQIYRGQFFKTYPQLVLKFGINCSLNNNKLTERETQIIVLLT